MNWSTYEEFYTVAPDYASLRRAIYHLKGRFDRLRVFPIGRSFYGREIFAMSLGDPRAATLYLGGIRGAEWLSTLLLCRFAEELLLAWEGEGLLAQIDVSRALEGRSLVIIPSLNPDGAEIAIRGREGVPQLAEELWAQYTQQPGGLWQANGRGVELGQNFAPATGGGAPGPAEYGGETPLSEPESRALLAFCRVFAPRQLYTFSGTGRTVRSSPTPPAPPCSLLMAQLLASSCGYRVAAPAASGGIPGWFAQTCGRPAFGVGLGESTPSLSQLEPVYRRLREALMLGIIL